MLLRPDGDAVICIGQSSHAWLSGQLARAWGNERFGAVAPWEEVCLAAEQHDIGMAEWDLAATLNPATGRPHAFTEMPLEVHLALWRAAPDKLAMQSSYAALLVSMHGSALYARRDTTPDVEAYLGAEAERQEALSDRAGAGEEEVARNQRLLWTWDFLSLALCLDWAPTEVGRVPTAGEPVILRLAEDGRLEPWPFAGEELHVRCEGRRLEGRFDDQEEMRRALGAAPPVGLEFALRR
jgi:uncharacterized protein DUF3891